jgi:hypothetical protein
MFYISITSSKLIYILVVLVVFKDIIVSTNYYTYITFGVE